MTTLVRTIRGHRFNNKNYQDQPLSDEELTDRIQKLEQDYSGKVVSVSPVVWPTGAIHSYVCTIHQNDE